MASFVRAPPFSLPIKPIEPIKTDYLFHAMARSRGVACFIVHSCDNNTRGAGLAVAGVIVALGSLCDLPVVLSDTQLYASCRRRIVRMNSSESRVREISNKTIANLFACLPASRHSGPIQLSSGPQLCGSVPLSSLSL